jgi:uncharacterized protein (DUF2267 family)
MSTSPKPTHLEERINLLTKDMASKRRSTNWSSNLTLIVGLLAILLLCGWYGLGYARIDEVTRPDEVLQVSRLYLQESSEQARRIAAREVQNSAPVWAKQASQELIANMPNMRESMESSIAQYFEAQLEDSEQMTRDQFASILKDHKDEFEDAISIIIQEGKSDEFVDRVMPIIEQNYASDMKESVRNVLGSLREINERLDKLSEGGTLNPIEEQQKHILGLARLLRERGFGSTE